VSREYASHGSLIEEEIMTAEITKTFRFFGPDEIARFCDSTDTGREAASSFHRSIAKNELTSFSLHFEILKSFLVQEKLKLKTLAQDFLLLNFK
jgi:hypothetical protein